MTILERIRKHPAVDGIEDARHGSNDDGCWVYLKDGWVIDGTHTIHEDTWRACAAKLALVCRESE